MPHAPIDLIREEIRRDGPMPFPRYMELALYGESGFYARPPVGHDRAFVTSPHVHPVFAGLLARAIAGCHDALGAHRPLLLTEAGAGDGTLLRGLLPALADRDVVATAVEVSQGAREALGAVPGVATVNEAIDGPFDVLIANELLDNLPFRLAHEGEEVGVGLDDDDDLVPVVLASGEELSVELDADVIPDGAIAFVEGLARAMRERPAYAILIDYGHVGPDDAGSVHGYAGQAVVADLFADPGASDITAGVDFAAIAGAAVEAGVQAFPTVTQRAALVALGFETWFEERLAAQHAQLADGDGVDAVRTWSDKSRASFLADPGGLGRFRWLVLASPGLPAPDWLQNGIAAGSGGPGSEGSG
jgi:SAM-dependent MidA family methyltransferase